MLTVVSKTADILGNPQEPNVISNHDSQMLYGEQFAIEKEHGAYVYGYSVLDGYKGFIERDQLIPDAPPADAIVQVRASHLYLEPSFKSRPVNRLSFLSRVALSDVLRNGFSQLSNNLWIFTEHLAPLANFKMSDDLGQTATIFLGTPYLYAGRSTFGIDCSGLVQQTVMACGYDCPPRDSKDQRGAIGKEVTDGNLQRNDIVFFDGHVGIMMDDRYIINATARHMSTVIEDIGSLQEAYGDIKFIARL